MLTCTQYRRSFLLDIRDRQHRVGDIQGSFPHKDSDYLIRPPRMAA